MKKEDKELLLKDLCARLPYGVVLEQTYKVVVIATNAEEILTRKIELYSINTLDDMTVSGIHNDGEEEICFFEEIKPYLFPLSSMTEEQKSYLYSHTNFRVDMFGDIIVKEDEFDNYFYTDTDDYSSLIDWLNKNHFDYRGLIPMGLAIDATGLNIY